jgi:hypothetical protein
MEDIKIRIYIKIGSYKPLWDLCFTKAFQPLQVGNGLLPAGTAQRGFCRKPFAYIRSLIRPKQGTQVIIGKVYTGNPRRLTIGHPGNGRTDRRGYAARPAMFSALHIKAF